MGSVSYKKTFILSLFVTAIVHISQCNSYPAINEWKKEYFNVIVDQEDNPEPKVSSFCQMGDMYKHCYPQLCKDEGHNITFPKPFHEVPHVMVAISALDMDNNHNSRLKVFAEEVTTTGFTLRIMPWSSTRLYNAGASWTACVSRETPCRR